LGTRPGGAIAGAWAAIHHLGAEGYRQLVASIMETTKRLQDGIRQIGDLDIVGAPPMSVFAFGSRKRHIFAIADQLGQRGWRIDRQADPDCLHLIVNPVHAAAAGPFLLDLRAAYTASPCSTVPIPSTVVYGVTADVPVEDDVREAIIRQIEERYDE
jgi:selenocysteine lyase/cysteine desulfurase